MQDMTSKVHGHETSKGGSLPIALSLETYRDKVEGCWRGKNCGGTLGAPIEKMWGDRIPFDLDFYPKIEEGGIPNDDLEIQLIWLMALEQRGLDITCRDLAEYWLDTINYNPDEYGLHKTNLRQGLMPPVSGSYNNYFKHSMGCPIRSEIWACIAPGLPHVAAHYAWHDGVCDHAQGESLNGEIFNAAVQSAAFLISDRDDLLDLGLSVIPESSLTSRTIRHARECHAKGLTWLEARNSVMEFAYDANAQYSPINLGFQTVGWLYGDDFGDAICKAVNCGWDTDCTAATLGAILGIVQGASNLPGKWTDPLGDAIATNESWNGLKNLRVPGDLNDLTDRTIAIGRQLLARHADRVVLAEEPGMPLDEPLAEAIVSHPDFEEILSRRQDEVVFEGSSLVLGVRYANGPVISCESPVIVELHVSNRGPDPLEVTLEPQGVPDGFEVKPGTTRLALGAFSEALVPFEVRAQSPDCIMTTNRFHVSAQPAKRPTLETVPVVLVGARRWLVSSPNPGATLEEPGEIRMGPTRVQPGSPWMVRNFPGNEILVEPVYNGQPGIVHLQHYFYNPEERTYRLGIANNGRMRLYVNGTLRHETTNQVPLRPSYWGDERNTADLVLARGWHHIAVVLERGSEPVQAHFTAAYDPTMWHGADDIAQTRFPWEAGDLAQGARNYALAED